MNVGFSVILSVATETSAGLYWILRHVVPQNDVIDRHPERSVTKSKTTQKASVAKMRLIFITEPRSRGVAPSSQVSLFYGYSCPPGKKILPLHS